MVRAAGWRRATELATLTGFARHSLTERLLVETLHRARDGTLWEDSAQLPFDLVTLPAPRTRS